jgi:hypothetical protein
VSAASPCSPAISPGAAAAEREWQQRIKEREDAILVAAYGERACRKAGLL